MSQRSSGKCQMKSNDKTKLRPRIPVILDTDIGSDIDDTWALALLLKSPELDVKMALTVSGNTTYRAKIIARLLEIAGRTDIPVGIGTHQSDLCGGQEEWVKDYDLSRYPGPIHSDGIDALIRLIMASPEPLTLISIGPLTNIAAALEREPAIARRCRLVGMFGSIRKGWGGSDGVTLESNVAGNISACRNILSAPWLDMTITPLDTCGIVRLTGKKFQAIRACPDPVTQAVIENYDLWLESPDPGTRSCVATQRTWFGGICDRERSSVLFDTVAIYLAFSTELLVMERIGLRIRDDGYLIEDSQAKAIHCAMAWKDLGEFEDFLVRRLVSVS